MGIAAETARLIAELSLDDKRFLAGAKRTTTALGGMEKGFGRVGKGAGQISAGLARSGTLIGGAVVAGLGASAKAAIDWQDAFQGVVKTVDEVDLNKAGLSFTDLSDGLREMSRTMPNTAVELAGIAANAGALGIAGKDILAFTKQVAIIASTTNVSADDAATALGQLQNVIGLTGDEFDNFTASLVDLGNKGASTEGQILEIARRAGGAAKLFGIAKDETLGWAAAAANLGLNEELAGTALQNTFVKLLPQISKGSKTLSEVMGKSAKDVKKAFAKDAGGALETLIARLGKMPKDARLAAVQKLFGKGSGITRLVLGLADSYEKNLKPALDDATDSWKRSTAAQAEFDKRNATVRSSIERLKNNVIDAAVSLGEGMAPAIGRASDKLASFLGNKENRSFLQDLGKDIGASIDAIDWQAVIKGGREFVDLLKIAFDYAKRMFDVINSLPTEVKAAGIGFLTLNKLSGGLLGAGVGNVVGGVGETIVKGIGASLPGPLGKAFVQPVFVTNFPAGGIGGAAGGAAGAAGKGLSGIAKVALVSETIGLALAVNEVRTDISEASTAQATAINDQTTKFIATQPSRAALENALAGVNQGISDLQSNPLNVLVQGEALTKLEGMRADLQAQLARTPQPGKAADDVITPAALQGSVSKAVVPTTTAVDSLRGKVADDLAVNAARQADTTTAVESAKGRIVESIGASSTAMGTAAALTTTAARNAGTTAASAARMAGYGVEAAIRANRPIVTTDVRVYVTAAQVSKTVTEQSRYGAANGSAGGGHAPGHGPLP